MTGGCVSPRKSTPAPESLLPYILAPPLNAFTPSRPSGPDTSTSGFHENHATPPPSERPLSTYPPWDHHLHAYRARLRTCWRGRDLSLASVLPSDPGTFSMSVSLSALSHPHVVCKLTMYHPALPRALLVSLPCSPSYFFRAATRRPPRLYPRMGTHRHRQRVARDTTRTRVRGTAQGHRLPSGGCARRSWGCC